MVTFASNLNNNANLQKSKQQHNTDTKAAKTVDPESRNHIFGPHIADSRPSFEIGNYGPCP